MWWNFTEYSVKYIYNVWHLWEANNCYRVLGKNLGYIYIYIYICEQKIYRVLGKNLGHAIHIYMVLQLFTECSVKKLAMFGKGYHCCSPSIVLQIVH